MSLAYQPSSILPGFNDPVHEAQTVFRQLLEAMSHPGVIVGIEMTAESPCKMSGRALRTICVSIADARSSSHPLRPHLHWLGRWSACRVLNVSPWVMCSILSAARRF